MAMDYSLVQRTPDGTGQFLVTTPGSPDVGSWETEAQLKTWIQQDIIDGTITAKKAECDQNGNVIDTTYETKADANDLKNALDSVDHRVQNLEQAKGDYVAVDSDKGVITTPSGKGKWAVVEKLRGVSRAVNNLLTNGDFHNGNTGWSGINGTITASDGVGTFTPSSFPSYGLMMNVNGMRISGHSYLFVGSVKRSVYSADVKTRAYLGGTVNEVLGTLQNTTSWQTIATVGTCDANGNDGNFGIVDNSGTANATQMKDFFVRDLNVYFGTSDLSFLGATDSAKLATIQQYYPWLLEPSDYGTSLVDSVYEGVKSEFVNIWDEEWDNGYLWAGSPASGTNVRSKNYIEVKPNTTYYLCTSAIINISFYDASKNSLSSGTGTQFGAGQTFTTDADTHYIKFFMDSAYGSSYGNNIQIADNSSPTKATYHAYHAPSTLTLPSPITLRSAGTVAEEFDLETGEKTNPLKTIDLGTDITNWGYDSTYAFFYTSLSDKAYGTDFLCDAYVNAGQVADPDMASVPTMSCATNGGVWFYIKNTSKNASDLSGGVASWLVGIKLNYKLATPNAPTQLTPIQNPTILTEAGGTITAQTEEPIDGNFSVGFITL